MSIFKDALNIQDRSTVAYIRRGVEIIGKHLANRLYPNITVDQLEQTITLVSSWVYIQALTIHATYHSSMVVPYIYSDLIANTEEVEKIAMANGFGKPNTTMDELVNFILSNDTKQINELEWVKNDDQALYIMRTILDRLNFEISLIGDK